MGVQNMQDRVQLLDGQFSIHSNKELGTKIFIKLPLNNNPLH